MTNRLSSVDVSYLYLEEPTTPMNVGSVLTLQGETAPCDVAALIEHIEHRIAYVPRYRQRLKWVPGHLANPLWVDDRRFDLRHHVHRDALPQPGSRGQLNELVARVMAAPLDRSRPLWQVHVVEGLAGGRVALITKCHQALVDGVHALDLSQVVLDPTPYPAATPPDAWTPGREPSLLELVSGAVADAVSRPSQVLETVRSGVDDLRSTSLGSAVFGVLAAVGTVRPAPESPLNLDIGRQRRFATLDTDLDDYRAIRSRIGAGARATTLTVHDVVLATVAGGLREWLLTRGAKVDRSTYVRALVPVGVRGAPPVAPGYGAGAGSDVEAFLGDLPVGEPNPMLRLQQVAFQTRTHADSGRGVPARALAGIGGFGPATVHSLGARLASRASKRVFNLLVTNAPGPQQPLYAAGARLVSGYPVMPLVRGQGLAIGVTSYLGTVSYGLNADWDALPDVDLLAECIGSALGELRDSVRS